MNKNITLLTGTLLASVALLASPVAAFAEDKEATLCSYCWEKGSFTQENPGASQVLLFPVRATTGVIGAPVGAVIGMGRGAQIAVKTVAEGTFNKMGDGNDDGHPVLHDFAYGTAGIIGTVIALPVGITAGAVVGTFKGIAKGYTYPDTF